jgi:hypothetical protein
MPNSASHEPPTRRSGRRSAASVSTSTSKTPDSPADELKELPSRPSLVGSHSSGRGRRLKEEDIEEAEEERDPTSSNNGLTNGRAKRRGRVAIQTEGESMDVGENGVKKGSREASVDGEAPPTQPTVDGEEEEENDITRCICGNIGAALVFSFYSQNLLKGHIRSSN